MGSIFMRSRSLPDDPSRHRLALPLAIAGLALVISGCGRPGTEDGDAPAGEASAFETTDQRVSYGIGYNIGTNIQRQGGLEVDVDALQAGLNDALAESEPRIPEAELEAAFGEVQERSAAAAAKEGEANLAAAKDYLAENRNRPDVNVTESGLQYEVLESGDGPKPTPSDTVEVHYHGTLIDGTVFDSSVERGKPVTFPVTGVIPGWVEALQLMSVGDKWRLTIPPELGYGPRATGRIPPNSTLIFEVELLGIE